MNGIWVTALLITGTATGVARAVMGDMVREEAGTRLGRIPFTMIHMAGRRVPADMRDDLTAEWEAELDFLLTATDGMPLTRLTRGVRYSAGLLLSARKITNGLKYRDRRITRKSGLNYFYLGLYLGLMPGVIKDLLRRTAYLLIRRTAYLLITGRRE